MKITKEQLKQIIKEEIESVITEMTGQDLEGLPTRADNTIDAQKLLKILRRSTQNARKNPKLRSSESFQQRIIPVHNHILRYIESNLAKIDKMMGYDFDKLTGDANRSYPDDNNDGYGKPDF